MKILKLFFNPLHLICLLLGLLILLGIRLIDAVPDYHYLASISVSKNTDKAVVLGYKELGQKPGYNSADLQHLKLRFDADKGWMLSNISATKKIFAKGNKGGFYLKRWRLQRGDILQLNAQKIAVLDLSANRIKLALVADNQVLDWHNGRLQAAEENFSACPGNSLSKKARLQWDLWRATRTPLFTLGGEVQCIDRWKLAGVPVKSASIEWFEGDFWFKPLAKKNVHFAFSRDDGSTQLLNDLESRAEGIVSLIIGRTLYQLTVTEQGDLKLVAKAQQHLFDEKQAAERSKVLTADKYLTSQWQNQAWGGAELRGFKPELSFYWLTGGLLLGGFWFAWLIVAWHQQLRKPVSLPATFFSLAMPMVCFTVAWRLTGDYLSVLLLLVGLSWSWLTLLLWRMQRLKNITAWLWLCLLFVAGFGLLSLSQLAAGAESTRWLRFAVGYCHFLLLSAVPLTFMALAPVQALQHIWQWLVLAEDNIIRSFYVLCIMCLLGLLLLQIGGGSESGLSFMQPIEFVKLLLIILLARMTLNLNEIRLLNSQSYQQARTLWVGRFVLMLLIALVVTAIVTLGVRDFSPLVIIFSLLLAYFWIVVNHPVVPRWQSIWKARSVVVFILLGIIAGGWLLHNHPDMAYWLPQSDRILIWANPWEYPDTGRQLQLSLERVHSGHWLGNNWFGSNAEVMNIPAIQDDFILAFVLFKFGGLLVLLLLFCQVAWVGLQFYCVDALLKISVSDTRKQRLALAQLAYMLYGLVWMQILHWFISWGNVLGFLPIMGQPMTWLSSGNSHLFAIALPGALLALLAGFVLDSKSSLSI